MLVLINGQYFLFLCSNRLFFKNYTVKNSFGFAKGITQHTSKLFMASLDVDSLFTNVLLEENTKICVRKLSKSIQTVSGLTKQQVLGMI